MIIPVIIGLLVWIISFIITAVNCILITLRLKKLFIKNNKISITFSIIFILIVTWFSTFTVPFLSAMGVKSSYLIFCMWFSIFAGLMPVSFILNLNLFFDYLSGKFRLLKSVNKSLGIYFILIFISAVIIIFSGLFAYAKNDFNNYVNFFLLIIILISFFILKIYYSIKLKNDNNSDVIKSNNLLKPELMIFLLTLGVRLFELAIFIFLLYYEKYLSREIIDSIQNYFSFDTDNWHEILYSPKLAAFILIPYLIIFIFSLILMPFKLITRKKEPSIISEKTEKKKPLFYIIIILLILSVISLSGFFYYQVNYVIPLVEAINNNDIDLIERCIDKGSNINIRGEKGKTALMCAVEQYDINKIKYFIEKGAKLNLTDSEGKTALHIAALDIESRYSNYLSDQSMFLNTARILISEGADINAVDKDGNTALNYILYKWGSNMQLIPYLAENNPDAGIKNLNKESSIMFFITEYEKKWEYTYNENTDIILKMLIKNKADINAVDKDGKTALMRILQEKDDVYERSQLLVKNFINVNIPDKNGETALMFISRNYDGNYPDETAFKLAELLLPEVDNINLEDNNGMTALINISDHGSIDEEFVFKIIKLYIEKGADINYKNKYGMTPLMYAVISGRENNIEFLIKNNADPFIKDNKGKSAYDYADKEIKELINKKRKKSLL